ncbi:MAG: hemerythrin domain-containing protein [Micrococcaceae bacterium]
MNNENYHNNETARVVAWSKELQAVHQKLRDVLTLTQDTIAKGKSAKYATRDLLLFCHGFCTALTGHHEGEDRELFPAIPAQYPQLKETLNYLKQDHSTIA